MLLFLLVKVVIKTMVAFCLSLRQVCFSQYIKNTYFFWTAAYALFYSIVDSNYFWCFAKHLAFRPKSFNAVSHDKRLDLGYMILK